MHVCMCMFTGACMWVDMHFICIYVLCVAENACVNVHCVFTFECMGFYTCAHKSVCMLCVHVYVHVGVGVCVCMFVLFVCICACIHIYICGYVHVCLC